MSAAYGRKVNQTTLETAFLTGPGSNLVTATLSQLASVPAFAALFGNYTVGEEAQRWADYERMDWSIRQLPVMNLFESQVEDKTSDQAWLNGTVSMQVFWPPNLRRSDIARVQASFKGIVENFFSSKYVQDMLDEIYFVQRPMKVYGLNEYGKVLNWTPQLEAQLEDKAVPATIVDVRYRIDLRAWNRALEYMGRTKLDPFDVTLADLVRIGVGSDGSGLGNYDGVPGTDASQVEVVIKDGITVSNP